MIGRIGNRLIAELRPAEHPYHVHDEDLPGFIVRVQPSGSMSYYLDYRFNGGPKRRLKIGKVGVLSPAQARDRARELSADLIKGVDPRQAKKAARVPVLREFIAEKYGPWITVNRKRGDETIRRIRYCFLEFLDQQLSEINVWQIEKWRAGRLKSGLSRLTINRDLIALRALLSKARAWQVISENPLRELKQYKADDRGRVRFLSALEEQRLRNALDERELQMRAARERGNCWRLDRGYRIKSSFEGSFCDHLKPMVILSINTGLRRGEMLSLKWENVDLPGRFISVVGAYTKNGLTRHVPLNDEVLAILCRWLDQKLRPSEYVFPGQDGSPIKDIKKSWSTVLNKAQIENFRWHDLRHTFASKLVQRGVALNTVRDLLGHADIKMTLRYAHLSRDVTAAAVATLVTPAPVTA